MLVRERGNWKLEGPPLKCSWVQAVELPTRECTTCHSPVERLCCKQTSPGVLWCHIEHHSGTVCVVCEWTRVTIYKMTLRETAEEEEEEKRVGIFLTHIAFGNTWNARLYGVQSSVVGELGHHHHHHAAIIFIFINQYFISSWEVRIISLG